MSEQDLTTAGTPEWAGLIAGFLYLNGILTVKSTTVDTSTDALDVSTATSFEIDSTDGDVTIGGLANGTPFQLVLITKKESANNVIIENNEATGTQKILTPDGSDITLSLYGGVVLWYSGSFWFVINC